MRTTALTIEGRAGIPALRMAMTQGDAAVPLLWRRPSSFGETMRPLQAQAGVSFGIGRVACSVNSERSSENAHDEDTDYVEEQDTTEASRSATLPSEAVVSDRLLLHRRGPAGVLTGRRHA